MTNVKRLTVVWLFLSAITVLSWQLGAKHGGQVFHHNVAITVAVIAFALIKVRFIMREFMGIRISPSWAKWVTDAWLIVVFCVLMVIYSL